MPWEQKTEWFSSGWDSQGSLPGEVTFEIFLQDQTNLTGQKVKGTGENVPGTGTGTGTWTRDLHPKLMESVWNCGTDFCQIEILDTWRGFLYWGEQLLPTPAKALPSGNVGLELPEFLVFKRSWTAVFLFVCLFVCLMKFFIKIFLMLANNPILLKSQTRSSWCGSVG